MKKLSLEQENNNMIKSIYIHIPFCNKICTYCDFCKIYYNKQLVNKYLEELNREFDKKYQNEEIETIYIGGGTPSSLNNNQLDELFKITNKIKLKKEYEFTFECNIENINENLLQKLKQNKINRISIGIESFNKSILDKLGRSYQLKINVKEKIDLVKKYFNNINIDLIYGIKNQTISDLQEDLNKFINLDINHISIYSLILENHTILKIKKYKEIEDNLSRQMYDYICKYLKEKGYNHYEISNFEKNNTASKHNLTYWDNDKYYGLGLGAAGYIKNIRYTNTRSITKYLNHKYLKEEELITKRIDMENFMILGLRKIKGISNKEFKKRYNLNIEEVFNTNKLQKKDDYYYIEESNLYISNYILQDFIE